MQKKVLEPEVEIDAPKLFCDRLCIGLRKLNIDDFEDAESEIGEILKKYSRKTRATNSNNKQ